MILRYSVEYIDDLGLPGVAGGLRYALEVGNATSVLFSVAESVSPSIFTDPGVPGGGQVTYRKTIEKLIMLPSPAAFDARVTVTAATGNQLWCECVVVTAVLYHDVRLTVTDALPEFLPLDSQDNDASQCAAVPGGCYPEFTARLLFGGQPRPQPTEPNGGYPAGRFRFTILPNSRVPVALRQLKGTSSNLGDGEGPDFEFSAARQEPNVFDSPGTTANGHPLMLTARANRTAAKAVVSSLDYGGTARLRAEWKLAADEPWVEAEVDRNNAPDPLRASLPIDDDDDGLADSWERRYASSLAEMAWDTDNEAGHGASSPRGDGLIAHDEYRGFHFIERTGGAAAVRWSRLDPVRKKDVFYWDPESQFVGAVGLILAAQGGPDPIHLYREVNERQASASTQHRRDPDRSWVEPIPRNSTGPGRPQRARALVVLIWSDLSSPPRKVEGI